ncbi:MAG: GTPase RsgA, partial [Clostridia bacterium]|nr:GTPase RsgA [Clostridia bacterium]
MTGIIIKALSGFFYVLSGDNVYECRARGNFRKSGKTPLVGDYAEISALDTSHGIIEEIRTRKSCLLRPPVANIEKLFIISSHSSPKPNTSIIDRMAAIAIYNGIEPVIVFNKCDMGDFSEFEKIYRNSSFKTYVVSAKTGEGISDLNSELTGCISAFTGNSGVG